MRREKSRDPEVSQTTEGDSQGEFGGPEERQVPREVRILINSSTNLRGIIR